MKLTILERIRLLEILPAESNFVTLKIVHALRDSLSFSEEETKAFEIKQEGSQITWNMKAETKNPEGTEIEIGERATDIIIAALRELDQQKKLTEQLLPIYEKFIKS